MDVDPVQQDERSARGCGMRRMRPAQSAVPGLAVLGLLLSAGCGGGPGPALDRTGPAAAPPSLWPDQSGHAAPQRAGCDVLAGTAAPDGVLTVAVTDSVLVERAPIPANAAERLVFAQLYETLVRVDCRGEIQPGLADTWSCTADSTVWIFGLRPDAKFWDGTPVTTDDVRQAWRDGARRPGDGRGTGPWAWLDARVGAVDPLDTRRLKVQLPEPQADLPVLLAHPATAVAVRRPGWTWPVGSGPARLRAATPPARAELVCRPNPQHPQATVWRELVFRIEAGRDLRDLVASGFDLARARDLATVEFYADAPGYAVSALPWDRLYLLVCPPEINQGDLGRWTAAADRLDPARDVTAIASLPWADVVFPAGGRRDCPQLAGPVAATDAMRRDSDLARTRLDRATLVFGAGDPGAREIAGRLAALAGPDVRTATLDPASLGAALRWQMTGALILARDQQFATACLELAGLLGQAQWLQDSALRPQGVGDDENLVSAERSVAVGDHPAAVLRNSGLVRPLLLTRSWLITRGELAGLRLDYDGTPCLAGVGPAAPADAGKP